MASKRPKRKTVYTYDWVDGREYEAFAADERIAFALTAAFERLGWLRKRPHDLNIG